MPSSWQIQDIDLPSEFLSAATSPVKIKQVLHSTTYHNHLKAFGFVFHNGVSEHRLELNLQKYSTDAKDVQNDRCWERSMYYLPRSDRFFFVKPFGMLGYIFDGNHFGISHESEEFSNRIAVKEKLEDNETFTGVKVILDTDGNVMDMSLKKGVMPDKTSLPILPVLSITSLESVQFSDTFTEARFLERFLTAKLPLSSPHSLIQDYEERALQEIVNSFAAKEPSADYVKAQRQLTWFATKTTKSKNGQTSSVKALFNRALDEKVKDPERFTNDTICAQTLNQMAAVLILVDKQDMAAQIVRRISKAEEQISTEDKTFASMELFNTAIQFCSSIDTDGNRDSY